MRVLVTGAAGFIGSQLALRLLERGDEVIGLDNMNAYYDVRLKRARVALLARHPAYTHVEADLSDRRAIEAVFGARAPRRVVNLAAQAGVRYASENPHAYAASNLTGFLHVLEGCRRSQVEHLLFASSSSVYGANAALPYSEHEPTAHPLSLYAATKKANEQMAHSYAHLYGIPCTGLRYFTVYGPWGRPDMALFLFTRAILAGEPIRVFNHGRHSRSFTYIDDAVEASVRALDRPPNVDRHWNARSPDPASSGLAPYRIYNVGSTGTVALMDCIEALERWLGRKAALKMLPGQPGDVEATAADCSDLLRDFNWAPRVGIEAGVERFVRWYRGFYSV